LNGFSDDILVAAAQRGDKSAYALLVKKYYRYVFAACLGVLGHVHDAEDLAQDAMLRGFLKIRKLRRSEQFDQWILRIAKNLCIDYIRRKKHARAYLAKQAAKAEQRTSENHELQQAIRSLPQELRLPLVMYYFDNKSAATIAEKLNISYSGVCQRIRAARKQLHRLLTKGVHDEQ
jgi:RNA polymerase sigma-70 factor (ECF subfamily)